ncbi:Riboflavin biosynthesis protein RibF [Hyella patelloides LEGE 07179]|uniref:Riboflavin biosynthesis protein n=1 Tax=Hyella patelloides LEGE 07179 TaxID=945734 RepID=A0A563VZD5_9CYAN|nr:bifunctional riboflavin kinase/FAD synthetase [Hyella patelloides]VEP16623.1 Riboflavin biosynthesis protein RibF [Hyella patelloides LEGE 07179]
MIITTPNTKVNQPTAIALGNFDGIHQGHQIVLQPIISQKSPHLYSSVVSFDPHPRQFFTGQKLSLLTPKQEKADYLATLGFQQLILIPFDETLAALSPQDFVNQILVEQLQTKIISIGEDFRFGYQRKGTAEDLKKIASQLGIEVYINSLHKYQYTQQTSVRVSSSLIRQALLSGELKQANLMLGRSYTLIGEVVKGKQIGRTIGFPTANLQVPPDKFLPRYGVYAVKVNYDNTTVLGVMNIGCRPTVKGELPTVEVHLLDWSGDLYNKTITVSLEAFLRPEQKFNSLDDLKQQIQQDCQEAKALLNREVSVKRLYN